MINSLLVTFGLALSNAIPENSSPDNRNPSIIFSSIIAESDSQFIAVSKELTVKKQFRVKDDSLLNQCLTNNQYLYGLAEFDNKGKAIANFNRDQKSPSIKGDISSTDWFKTPFIENIPFCGGIVKANSKLCILKSYPINGTTQQSQISGVLLALIDIGSCLEQVELKSTTPFSLTYNSIKIYGSSSTGNLPLQYTVPGCNDLTIHYSPEIIPESIDGNKVAPVPTPTHRVAGMPIEVIYITTILLIAVACFIAGRYSRKKVDKKALVELEYQRIKQEKQKQIHDMAMSQLYCEIKRQIETHEAKKIEDEVRHKIEDEIHHKIMAG